MFLGACSGSPPEWHPQLDGGYDLATESPDLASGPDLATTDLTPPTDLAITPVATPMVQIASGSFAMGGGCSVLPCASAPIHEVTLSAYSIDQTEVTQQAYDRCVLAGACSSAVYSVVNLQAPAYPVSWQQASAYCTWAGKHLPTEAQWEMAARGTGTISNPGGPYPWGSAAPDCTYANYMNCSGMPISVTTVLKDVSPFGVDAMAGNVIEWVADYYDPNYYATSPSTDPTGPASGGARVTRGGDWQTTVTDGLTVYARALGNPTTGAGGFRCAK